MKILLISGGIYVVSVILIFGLMIITAGLTSKMSAGEMGPVLWFLLAAGVVVFAVGTFVVHRVSTEILAGHGTPWLMTILFLVGSCITLVILGFITLVLFNR